MLHCKTNRSNSIRLQSSCLLSIGVSKPIPYLAQRRFVMAAYNVKAHPAFAGYDVPASNGALGGFRRAVQSLAAWSHERRSYNRAVFELDQLSDRDLADIGIARCDIPAVARETAKAELAKR
jgi:uncharacterized protein YjiS (DUF1127 family)